MSGTPAYRGLAVLAVIGILAAYSALLPGFAQDNVKPGPERSTYSQFLREVVPILESRCGISCHAVPADEYREWMTSSPIHAISIYFPTDPRTGHLPDDPDLKRMAFDVVRGAWTPGADGGDDGGHGGGAFRIDYQAAPEFSPLLRAPLSEIFGGEPHRGMDIFYDTRDPDYQTLYKWVAAEIALHPEEPPALTPAAEFFRDNVVGVLERNGCFLSSCHGSYVFNDLKLVKPLPRTVHRVGDQPPARLSPRMLAKQRKVVLGKTPFVNLAGDLKLSRLIVKNLPIAKGGVHQRGGNKQFFESYDDPDVEILLDWMRLEKAAVESKLTSGGASIPEGTLGVERGIAFLRGPRHQPRRFWEFDGFYPGTRLLILAEGATEVVPVVDLPGVEIQSFDVRYDARALVFSMREGEDQGFRIWRLGLDDDLRPVEGSMRPVSFGPARHADGTLIHHVDPIYIPKRSARPDAKLDMALDEVALAFASNAAGTYSNSQPWAILGEADSGLGDLSTLVDLQRVEPEGTFDGRRLYIIAGADRGAWRTIARHRAGGRLELDTPLEHVPDVRTVYMIEQLEADWRSAFDIWRMELDRPETARRFTWTNAQERRPTMRTTGEVMATTVRNRGFQGGKPVYNGAIYRMQGGGWDYHIQGGNRSGYPLYADSRELPQGLEVRLALDPRNLWGGGELIIADHGFGVHIEPNNPVDDLPYTLRAGEGFGLGGTQRFLPPQFPVFPESGPEAVTVTGLSPGGSIRDPYPLKAGTILLARTAQSLDHLDPAADPDWDIYRLGFENNSPQSEDGFGPGKTILQRLEAASTSEFSEYSPRPVVVRLKEKSVTHQKFHARGDGKKPEPVDGILRLPPDVNTGEIESYDYPLLQSFLTNFYPGQKKDFREDELRYIRIVQQIPRTKADIEPVSVDGAPADPFATAVGLGVQDRQIVVAEVPLERDGSFYAKIPAEVPLIVQGLNKDRMALHAMNRWFYVQPGEKLTFSIPRSIFTTRCHGCHGALTGDRDDTIGPPDLVTAASAVMATWNEQDGRRRSPHPMQPVAVDFRTSVEPILEARCAQCHGADAPGGGLDLSSTALGPWTRAYVSLHRLQDPRSGNHADKRYIDEREGLSSQSYLIEKLTGVELYAPRKLDAPGTRHVPDLTREELLTLIRWIDLGATFKGGDAP